MPLRVSYNKLELQTSAEWQGIARSSKFLKMTMTTHTQYDIENVNTFLFLSTMIVVV